MHAEEAQARGRGLATFDAAMSSQVWALGSWGPSKSQFCFHSSLTQDGIPNCHEAKEEQIKWQRMAEGLLPLMSGAWRGKSTQELWTHPTAHQ